MLLSANVHTLCLFSRRINHLALVICSSDSREETAVLSIENVARMIYFRRILLTLSGIPFTFTVTIFLIKLSMMFSLSLHLSVELFEKFSFPPVCCECPQASRYAVLDSALLNVIVLSDGAS